MHIKVLRPQVLMALKRAPALTPDTGVMNRHTSFATDLQILIVDDHAIVREGLKRILESSGKHMVVSEASGGAQALEMLGRQRIDLMIIDLSMPGMSGLDLIKRVHAEYVGVGLLVLSMHAEEQYALRAFQAGAKGYVTKDSAGTELLTAVRRVVEGGTYVSAHLAERVVMQLTGTRRTPRHSRLSDRELEVLRGIVAGHRLTDIAHELHLSVKTISTHKSRIQEKLELPTTASLIRYGIEHGMSDDDDASQAVFDSPSQVHGP